jgi:hypothetical protein
MGCLMSSRSVPCLCLDSVRRGGARTSSMTGAGAGVGAAAVDPVPGGGVGVSGDELRPVASRLGEGHVAPGDHQAREGLLPPNLQQREDGPLPSVVRSRPHLADAQSGGGTHGAVLRET